MGTEMPLWLLVPVILAVLSRVQLYVVPETPLGEGLKLMPVVPPLQKLGVLLVMVTLGVGLTTTDTLVGVPKQLLATGVMVNVTV